MFTFYSLARLLLPSAHLLNASTELPQTGISTCITKGYTKANPVSPEVPSLSLIFENAFELCTYYSRIA